jgi:hypothetical protein
VWEIEKSTTSPLFRPCTRHESLIVSRGGSGAIEAVGWWNRFEIEMVLLTRGLMASEASQRSFFSVFEKELRAASWLGGIPSTFFHF